MPAQAQIPIAIALTVLTDSRGAGGLAVPRPSRKTQATARYTRAERAAANPVRAAPKRSAEAVRRRRRRRRPSRKPVERLGAACPGVREHAIRRRPARQASGCRPPGERRFNHQ